jgi:hypothetical protein
VAAREGRDFVNRRRGYREIVLMEEALVALAARQTMLLAALLRRGHASAAPLALSGPWRLAVERRPGGDLALPRASRVVGVERRGEAERGGEEGWREIAVAVRESIEP